MVKLKIITQKHCNYDFLARLGFFVEFINDHDYAYNKSSLGEHDLIFVEDKKLYVQTKAEAILVCYDLESRFDKSLGQNFINIIFCLNKSEIFYKITAFLKYLLCAKQKNYFSQDAKLITALVSSKVKEKISYLEHYFDKIKYQDLSSLNNISLFGSQIIILEYAYIKSLSNEYVRLIKNLNEFWNIAVIIIYDKNQSINRNVIADLGQDIVPCNINDLLVFKIKKYLSLTKTHLNYHQFLDQNLEISNKQALKVVLSKKINVAQNFAVLFIDIDNFKKVNDHYSHVIADQKLKNFVNIVKQNIRENDGLFRYGGDEFVIILSNVGNDNLGQIVDRVFDKIKNNTELECSVGSAVYENGDNVESILIRANYALQNAKFLGKKQLCSL